MKAVDPHPESVKLLFDVVPERIVEPTAEIKAREGNQIAVAPTRNPVSTKSCFRSREGRNAVVASVPRRSNNSVPSRSFVLVSIAG